MENPPRKKRKPKLECVFKCEDSKHLFRFPQQEDAHKLWLERIGLESLPCRNSLARICNKHFSEFMCSENGKRLTQCALPDINIPGVDVTPDGNLRVIKPRPVYDNINLADIPRIVHKEEIIISRASRCILKCRDAQATFGFPQDQASRDVWAKQLGFENMHPSTRSRVCSNHFSPQMFTRSKARRLTMCAIPDINLPSDTVFISETDTPGYVEPTTVAVDTDPKGDIQFPETEDNSSPNQQEMNELFQSVIDAPVIMEDAVQSSQQEILINPIENIKNVVKMTSNKEGILHVYQPGIERKSEDIPTVAVPENVVDADSECVLKCPHGERLFRFPRNEDSRQFWLKQIGLTHCYFNTKICDKHFSESMFIQSKKRLAKHAYPDINIPTAAQPRIKDASKVLNDYRIILEDNHVCDVMELPQYICVLTVFKAHTEVDAVVNGNKYVHHKVDDSIPKREREVQVDAADLIRTANVGISADDYVDDFDIEDTVDYEQQDWISMFKSHVFASKADMYECLICGEISVGNDCNVKHSNSHKERKSLCFQCGQIFSSQHKLKMHEKSKHLNKLRKALRCPKMHCNKAFHSKKQLHHHVDVHTKQIQHKCNKCLRVFSSFLKLHCHQVACRNLWSLKYPKRAFSSTRSKIK